DAASACSSESSRTRTPVARRSTTTSADSSTMRPASAAPSISDGASNHAVATPSTTRQSVPISVMPGTVESISDDLLPDSDHVPAGALKYAVDHDQARRHLITYCGAAWPTTLGSCKRWPGRPPCDPSLRVRRGP